MDHHSGGQKAENVVELVAYEEIHRQALLELSIRAWAPVFPLMKTAVPRFVYESFYPQGWETRQRTDIAQVLDEQPETIDVATKGATPVGWVSTRIHPEDFMAEIYVLAVDPVHQGSGVAPLLLERSYERARSSGMRMMMVETVDDPGHAPARGLYEASGFVRWPVARYFKDLSEDNES